MSFQGRFTVRRMMSKTFALVFGYFTVTYILYTNGATIGSTSCPLPSKFKSSYDFNWESRNNEWINTKSKTDYLLLSLSW